MPQEENARFEATVKGYVQGVCFRHYTRRRARELGLNGWVRNEPSGDVTVLAEGDKEALHELVEFLNVGPSGARVNSVNASWTTFEGDLEPFSVAH